jgi:hypothetical protein
MGIGRGDEQFFSHRLGSSGHPCFLHYGSVPGKKQQIETTKSFSSATDFIHIKLILYYFTIQFDTIYLRWYVAYMDKDKLIDIINKLLKTDTDLGYLKRLFVHNFNRSLK